MHYENYEHSQMFYKCFEKRAFLLKCPEQQEWSIILERCDFHENSNCKQAN